MNPQQRTQEPNSSAETSPAPAPELTTPQRDKGMEMILPINRSGWSIAAGYIALFYIPFLFLVPIGMILGIIALVDIKKNPQRAGEVRAWFAILYGAISLFLLVLFLLLLPK